MGEGDYIGSRGESIAYTRLTEVARRNRLPFFLPHFLGEKCPRFDFLVELVGVGERRTRQVEPGLNVEAHPAGSRSPVATGQRAV